MLLEFSIKHTGSMIYPIYCFIKLGPIDIVSSFYKMILLPNSDESEYFKYQKYTDENIYYYIDVLLL